MAIKVINIGSSANKGDGDPLRTAFTKINENFAALDPTGTNTITDITGSVFADDSALMVDGVNGKIVGPIESTSILPGNGLTDIGSTGNRFYNAWFTGQVETDSVLANIFYGPLTGNVTGDVSGTAGAVAFSGITGKPTTVAGYGITDALSGAVTGSNTGTVNFTGATLNFVSTTFNGLNFDDLGTTPTTIAGYGITDALALGTSSTTALAGDTALFSGDYDDLSNKPTIPTAYTDSDVDTHLNTGSATSNEVLSWDGSDYAWVASGGSGLQSRSLRTNQTSSLADGAEADLDITGFKAYALMAITTDRAARVRLYVKAASRTADASRAEGVDPTSDAGLIAEVITTGADTVIISPGAYGFNLESSTTTNIPCRVTNKSGSTSTVQVTLVVLQLEA